MIKCRALRPDDTDAMKTSEIVELVSKEIISLLTDHPLNLKRRNHNKSLANVVLFRGCSKSPGLSNFDSFHSVSWNPAMMARTCIISGIGKELGFNICSVYDNEVVIENDLTIRKDLQAFINDLHTLRSCIFAFFHIKVVDEASHDHDHTRKINLIESIDLILKDVIERLTTEFTLDEFRIIVTGDHSTLCRIGEHSCEPVPFLISKPLKNCTAIIDNLNESILTSCFIDNNLGRFAGESIIEFLKNILNKTENQ